jgi:hypothetical protein
MATHKDKALWTLLLGQLGKIDDLRHICQIIAGESYDIGLPPLEDAEILAMAVDLQVNEPNVMAGLANSLGNEL